MKNNSPPWVGSVLVALLVLAEGCASSPPPRELYRDSLTSIRLEVDERRNGEHGHPARVSTEQMAAVLNGVRVISRKGMIGSMVMGEAQAAAAFSPMEIQALAPQLSHALAQAKPEELVTFYRRYTDVSVGLAVTSGGLFVQDQHLYFILANDRTLPSDSININMMYEIDPVDNPLQPISRNSFRASFVPSYVLVPPDERRPWPYIDEGRILAVDLKLLDHEMKGDPSASKR